MKNYDFDNDGMEYHLDPTPDQLDLIEDLIGELPPITLDWLFAGIEGWKETNLDFWLKSYGRAEDLISTLEHMLNKEGTNEP